MENTATIITKKRGIKKKLRTKKVHVEISHKELRNIIQRAEKSEQIPLDIEAFRKEFIYPLEEAEKKKKALQGK